MGRKIRVKRKVKKPSKKVVLKKKVKSPEPEINYRPSSAEETSKAYGYLSRMKIQDMQREALIRGLPFHEIGMVVWDLKAFIVQNWNKPQNPELLNKFDQWRYNDLVERGELPIFVRLGTKPVEAEEEVVEEKPKKKKRKIVVRKKKEAPIVKHLKMNKELGVKKGTKKELTIKLSNKGLPIEKIIKKVKAKFSDAKDKSIKIWHQANQKIK